MRKAITFLFIFLSLFTGCKRPTHWRVVSKKAVSSPYNAMFIQIEPIIKENELQQAAQAAKKYPEWDGFNVFRIISGGFVPCCKYQVFEENIAGDVKFLYTCVANHEGFLFLVGSHLPLSNMYILGSKKLLLGEPIRYYIEDAFQTQVCETVLVQRTLGTSGNDGARFSLMMLDEGPHQFLCVGSGFLPCEKIRITSTSEAETDVGDFQADKCGQFRITLRPSSPGLCGGEALLRVDRMKNGEVLRLSYLWGTEAHREISSYPLDSQRLELDQSMNNCYEMRFSSETMPLE